MMLHALSISLLPLFYLMFCFSFVPRVNSFIYAECSQFFFNSMTPYELNVNSLFTSLVNSSSTSNFNEFEISSPPPANPQSDVVYGLFQCQGDLSYSGCQACVANSVSELKKTCPLSTGGTIQLEEGCFVKYDNASFFGVEDKMEVLKRCGPSIGYNADALNDINVVLADLVAGNDQYFRVGASGSVQGVAQCVQDLSVSECQDCVLEARVRIGSECGTTPSGDMFLGKCYIRYVDHGFQPKNGKHLLKSRLLFHRPLISCRITCIVLIIGTKEH